MKVRNRFARPEVDRQIFRDVCDGLAAPIE